MKTLAEREHGGDLDRARARFGGDRADWLDLSTGINPNPYPVGPMPTTVWTDLPDRLAVDTLVAAARQFWNVPEGAEIVIAPGASALIAAMPAIAPAGPVHISTPTYNEHAAAFRAAGRAPMESMTAPDDATVRIVVHPNNPDGRLHDLDPPRGLDIIDESFADVGVWSYVERCASPGTVVLKSFGKFWGLAGLRLGFAIAAPETCDRLRQHLGPWAASGPALEIGARALSDTEWAASTRNRLATMARALDNVLAPRGTLIGGTSLFRLYSVPSAGNMQQRLARHRIWTRIFAEHPRHIRLGLPPDDAGLDRIRAALA